MKSIISIVFVLSVALLVTQRAVPYRAFVGRAPDSFDRALPLPTAYQLIKNREAVAVDTRTPGEYRHGHIRGAIPRSALGETRPRKPLIFYGHSEDLADAMYAAQERERPGERIYVLMGGYSSWDTLELPREPDSESAP